MNPLPFFPPPSRSLSRAGNQPPPSLARTRTGGTNSGNHSPTLSSGSGQDREKNQGFNHGLTSLSTSSSSSSASSGERWQQASSGSSGDVSDRAMNAGASGGGGAGGGGSASGETRVPSSGSGNSSRRVTPGMTSLEGGTRSPLYKSSSSSGSSQAGSGSSSPRRVSNRETISREGTITKPSSEEGTSTPSTVTGPGGGHDSDSGSRKTKKPAMSTTNSSTRRPSSSSNSTAGSTSGGRLGTRLPQGMYFDLVRPEEVSAAFKLEVQGFSSEDAATLDKLRYRQKNAPHLFMGAYIPTAPPKVSGPLTMAGPSPRKLIGYCCSTASSALTARAMSVHSDDEHAWLVCLHSVCVAPEYQRRGVALRMIEEYMRRLRRAEEGKGDRKQGYIARGYERVALLAHEELIPLYEKAGFAMLGVSHVNHGTGEWFELRRPIIPDDEGTAAAKKKTAVPEEHEEEVPPPTTKTSTATVRPIDTATYHHTGEQVASPVSDAGSRGSGAAEKNVEPQAAATSPTDQLGLPAGITTSQILAALRGQSGNGNSSSTSAQGQQRTVSSSSEGPKNPGIAYSTIMGQTLAAKTSVEDAFFALEARLVDRETNMNLAELYCPREECACLLLRPKTADWELAEMGPLANPNLRLGSGGANINNNAAPAPPATPMPPPPASLDRIRSALGASRPPHGSTPARPFWTVVTPMSFDNIGFSKDDVWRPPPPSASTQGKQSSNGGGNSNSGGATVTSPRLGAMSGEESSDGGAGTTSGAPERKKPQKRGSLFSRPSEWRKDRQERAEKQALEQQQQQQQQSQQSSQQSQQSQQQQQGQEGEQQDYEPLEVKVKYLTCAECDCGPLGYTVLPTAMQQGGLAQSVGQQIGAQQQGGQGGESKSQEQGPGQQGASEIPLFLIAADRVRYRFPKTG